MLVLLVQGGALVPYYAQMQHVGLDVQGTVGSWLWKLETVYKDSEQEYVSSDCGFEYTRVGVLGSVWIGWIIGDEVVHSGE